MTTSSIPPLAGICEYEEAATPGLSVEETVRRLRRHVFIHSRLNLCIAAHLNEIPELEVKGALSLHVWQNAEHNTWLRNRVTEMRQPPLHLERVPDGHLENFFEELIRGRGTLEILAGIYEVLMPALIAAMEQHLREANPLADYPTARILRFCLLEKYEQKVWADKALAAIRSREEDEPDVTEWKLHLQAYLLSAGGIHGEDSRGTPESLPSPRAVDPFEPQRIPQREKRFQRIRNSRGLAPKANESREQQLLHMAYIRYTEMHVPELLALTLYDWKGQPWSFYHDICRHLWDEARHSMLGEVIFSMNGIDTSDTVQEISFAAYPNTKLSPPERYALLWGIEQGAMAKTGKQAEFVLARDSDAPVLASFQDFDWADEVLHAQIGRRWLLPAFDGSREALDACYHKVREEYDALANEDLQNLGAEWWSDFYKQVQSSKGGSPLSL